MTSIRRRRIKAAFFSYRDCAGNFFFCKSGKVSITSKTNQPLRTSPLSGSALIETFLDLLAGFSGEEKAVRQYRGKRKSL